MILEELLEDGYIVVADGWMNVVVVWNGSVTFNVYSHVEDRDYKHSDTFVHYGCFNTYEAKQVAKKWVANLYDQMERYFALEAA